MRIARIVIAVYFVAFAALIVLLRLAAPGPDGQAIQGVRIGAWGNERGMAYFSGKRLHCEAAAPGSRYTEVCRIDIAGRPLTLSARLRLEGEPLMNALGACAAEYAGQTWPCELQSHFNYPGAAVTYLEGGLGLDSAQLAVVRQRFPIENLPEASVIKGLLALWPVTAVAFIGGLFAFWPASRRGKRLDGLAIAAVSVVVVLALPLALMLAARGFWD